MGASQRVPRGRDHQALISRRGVATASRIVLRSEGAGLTPFWLALTAQKEWRNHDRGFARARGLRRSRSRIDPRAGAGIVQHRRSVAAGAYALAARFPLRDDEPARLWRHGRAAHGGNADFRTKPKPSKR